MKDLRENMALFYLKLYAKYLLPTSVIQDIIEQFNEINEEVTTISDNKLRETLNSMFVDKEILNDALKEFNNRSILKQINGTFDTHYKRMQYLKKEFNFVAPREILLGQNKLKQDCYMQYVPLLSTIQTLLSNKHIFQHIVERRKKSLKEGVLADVIDGAVYRNCPLFQNCPDSLSIILFQDAFEIVNPLGSAKKKHKLIGVYFTLANLHPSYRSNVDNIQLLLLCRETDLKFFGQEKILM
jgi:hypothetical protein